MGNDDIDVLLSRASAALDRGEAEQAVALYEQVRQLDARNPEACLMLGSLYGEQGRLDEAEALLKEAMALQPGDAGAALVLARIYSATGRLPEAIEVLEGMDVVADPEVARTLGGLLEATGERERAQRLLEQATESAPGDAEAWFALGAFHMNGGNFGEAEPLFARALECDAAHCAARGYRAIALTQLDRAEEAEQLLREGLEGSPEAHELHYFLATVLRVRGMNAEALDACDKALAAAPGETRYLIEKAHVLENMGDLEQAFELIRPVLSSGRVPVEAALLFARLSHPLGVVEQGQSLLQRFLEQSSLAPVHRQYVSDALKQLEQAT